MRLAVEKVRALRIKLKMLGIPVEEATYVLGDNESVIKRASRKEAMLNKKHQAICWHAVRESCAAGWVRVGWEPSDSNTADLFTKALDERKRNQLLKQIYP